MILVILDSYTFGYALCGKPPSPAIHRLIGRSFAEAREQETDAGRERQARLGALDGLPCPLCRRLRGVRQSVEHHGTTLICPEGHGWSNPDVAEAEILRGEFGGGEARC